MIAHLDADAFFASVLQRQHPELRGKPLLALGMGGGCVIAASYEAKAKGIKTGMRFTEAKKLCPEAIAKQSDFLDACAASQHIESIIRDRCATVEKYSVDEWFLDLRSCVGGTPKHLREWSLDLQAIVARDVGLTVSVGIATSKLLAKMSSEYRKPAGTTVIGKELSIEAFLRDRPAEAIPGIGSKRSLHTQSRQWKTAWDIAKAPTGEFQQLFGKPGKELQQELNGEMVFAVAEDRAPPKSISRCRSFRAVRDRSMIFGSVLQHLTYCTLKMRKENLATTLISMWLRDGDYRHRGFHRKLPQPLNTEDQLLPYVQYCFGKLFDPSIPCTQAGLALCNLRPEGALQYSLFEDPTLSDKTTHLQQSLDAIRSLYGRDSIVRAPGIGNIRQKKSLPDIYGNIVEM